MVSIEWYKYKRYSVVSIEWYKYKRYSVVSIECAMLEMC